MFKDVQSILHAILYPSKLTAILLVKSVLFQKTKKNESFHWPQVIFLSSMWQSGSAPTSSASCTEWSAKVTVALSASWGRKHWGTGQKQQKKISQRLRPFSEAEVKKNITKAKPPSCLEVPKKTCKQARNSLGTDIWWMYASLGCWLPQLEENVFCTKVYCVYPPSQQNASKGN